MKAAWTSRLRPLLLALLALGSAGAVAAPTLAEARQLDALARRAFDEPDQALAELTQRWPADFQGDDAREGTWRYTRGRVLFEAGRTADADTVATGLESRPESVAFGWLLRATMRDRLGDPAGELAGRALDEMQRDCPLMPPPQPARPSALPPPACRAPVLWQAMRLVVLAHAASGEWISAENGAHSLVTLAHADGSPRLLLESLIPLGEAQQALGRNTEAQATLHAAHAAAPDDALGQSDAWLGDAVLARRNNDSPRVRQTLEQALAWAVRANSPHQVARMRAYLVDADMNLGQLRQAVAVGRQALPDLQRFRDHRQERTLHHNLAVAYIKLHQFDAAQQELDRVHALSVNRSDLVRQTRELNELADAWAGAGRDKEALAAIHAEFDLNNRANELNRDAALAELRSKYDAAAQRQEIALLARDSQTKDSQLANRQLAQKLVLAGIGLVLLLIALSVLMLLDMRRARVQLTANRQRLQAQSERDPLTGLSNRRHFLAEMAQRARETDREGLRGALMMIDIDHFKSINDQWGHGVGDAVIVAVAQRIRAAMRDDDLVVRWGGEEFLVFARGIAGANLDALVERLLQDIAGQPVLVDHAPGDSAPRPLRVTASIGFVGFPLGSLRPHWEQAVNWTDRVLYRAKAQGRNRAVGIVQTTAADAATLGRLLQDLEQACAEGAVRLLTLPGPQAGASPNSATIVR